MQFHKPKTTCTMCGLEMIQQPNGLYICRHCDNECYNSTSMTDPCRNSIRYFGAGPERWK